MINFNKFATVKLFDNNKFGKCYENDVRVLWVSGGKTLMGQSREA